MVANARLDLVRLNLDRILFKTKLIIRCCCYEKEQASGSGAHCGYAEIISAWANKNAEVLNRIPAAVRKQIEAEIRHDDRRKPRRKKAAKAGQVLKVPHHSGETAKAS